MEMVRPNTLVYAFFAQPAYADRALMQGEGSRSAGPAVTHGWLIGNRIAAALGGWAAEIVKAAPRCLGKWQISRPLQTIPADSTQHGCDTQRPKCSPAVLGVTSATRSGSGILPRLHSLCPVDRCGRRCSEKIDQRLGRQRLLGDGWRTSHVDQVRALQIGWQRADNFDALNLHQLADRLHPISASPRWTISPTRAELGRQAAKPGESSASARRRCRAFLMPSFSKVCARWMPLVPPLAGSI